MDLAYDPSAWYDFFAASAGALAALSGLIFVGVSVNLRHILDFEKHDDSRELTGRASEALTGLVLALMISLVSLVPAVHHEVLGVAVIVAAATSSISPVRAARERLGLGIPFSSVILRFVLGAVLTVTYLVAGLSVLLSVGGGLYWLPGAFLLAVVIAAVNAWVLLVDVLR